MTRPPIIHPSDAAGLVGEVAEKGRRKAGQSGVFFAKIASGYTPGTPPANPAIVAPGESSGSAGAKLHKGLQRYNRFSNKPAANDIIAVVEDDDGNRLVLGEVGDHSALLDDAGALAGMEAVEPGTTTTHGTANTERSTTSTSYVKVKEFFVSRPGRYRIQFRLSRSGGTATAIVRIQRPDGTYLDASATVSESSAAYPTFSAQKTLDMNITLWWGGLVSVWLLSTLGTAQTAYLDTCTIKSQPATASLTAYDAVVTD